MRAPSCGAPYLASDVHAAAVRRTLTWAEESASRGDYEDALAWLTLLEAIGEELAGEYDSKRRAWRRARAERVGVRNANQP